MPDELALVRGRKFEQEVNETLGLSDVPGSGNQWSSLGDGQGHGLRVSAKSTQKRSWAETRAQLREAIDLAHGTGQIPALAIEDPADGERLILMRLTDAAALLAGESRIERRPRRAEVVRDVSSVPVLLRDQE